MNEKIKYTLNGQTVRLQELMLYKEEQQLYMAWKAIINKVGYYIIFNNVSRMNLESLSSPLEIGDIVVECNSDKGWDSDSRYFIYDCEEHKISFYCENFEVSESKETLE